MPHINSAICMCTHSFSLYSDIFEFNSCLVFHPVSMIIRHQCWGSHRWDVAKELGPFWGSHTVLLQGAGVYLHQDLEDWSQLLCFLLQFLFSNWNARSPLSVFRCFLFFILNHWTLNFWFYSASSFSFKNLLSLQLGGQRPELQAPPMETQASRVSQEPQALLESSKS